MTNSLVAYNQDGLELVINVITGESYASMSATARLCVCEVTQIRRLVGDTKSLKAFNIKTSNGDKDVKLLNEEQILKCLVKYNPQAILKFAQAGLRVYLHKLAGYQVTSNAVEPKKELTRLELIDMARESELRALALEAQIEADLPYTEIGQAIANCDGVPIGEYSKALNMTRNKTFQLLRDLGFIMKSPSTMPYQSQINNGNFTVTATVKTDRSGKQRQFNVSLITGKGQIAVQKAIKKANKIEAAHRQLELVLDSEIQMIKK